MNKKTNIQCRKILNYLCRYSVFKETEYDLVVLICKLSIIIFSQEVQDKKGLKKERERETLYNKEA